METLFLLSSDAGPIEQLSSQLFASSLPIQHFQPAAKALSAKKLLAGFLLLLFIDPGRKAD